MKNPWDSTTEGIYDWQDDPIAAYADEGAAYRKAMQEAMEAEAAYQIAQDLANANADAKYYADVILPKVKPLTDAEAKAKTQIAVAKAKADLAKAKARTSLIEVTLAEIEAKTKLIHNRLLKPAAASITETALNKSYTAVAKELSIEAATKAEAETDLTKATLAKAKDSLINAEEAQKAKAEAAVAEARADLVLIEVEITLTKVKAAEAEAKADLARAHTALIETNLVCAGLVDRVEKHLAQEAGAKAKAETEVSLAEVALTEAEAARARAETDLTKAKADLDEAKTLSKNLNRKLDNRKRDFPPSTKQKP